MNLRILLVPLLAVSPFRLNGADVGLDVLGRSEKDVFLRVKSSYFSERREKPWVLRPKNPSATPVEIVHMFFDRAKCTSISFGFREALPENDLLGILQQAFPGKLWARDFTSVLARTFTYSWITSDGAVSAYYNDRCRGDVSLLAQTIRAQSYVGLSLFLNPGSTRDEKVREKDE